jgi:hypothetical protein
MRSSVTCLLDDLGKLLSASPALIAKYEQSDPDFPGEVLRWLGTAEQILERSGLTQVADVSALKGRLLASKNGVLEVSFVVLPVSSQSRRKTSMAVSALVFGRAQEVLGGLYEHIEERREEALKYTRQMVMLMEQQGVIPSTDGLGRSQALSRLFASMRGNTASVAAARHVLTLVNYADALRLLDETLTEWELEP